MRISLYFAPVAVSAAALFSGCSTPATDTALLEEARASYSAAQNDQRTAALAPVELQQAGEALAAANHAYEQQADGETVNHLAYLSKQKTAIAQSASNRKASEQLVENASKERDQIRLAQRSKEADQAKLARDQAYSQLQAKKTARGMVVTLGDVLFNSGSSELKPGGTRNLQKLAQAMRNDPQMKISVEGFTDSTGNASRNRSLSEERAAAVKDALVGMGISADRISSQGYGPQYPVASNNTASGRQMNRRVEVVLSEASGETSSGQSSGQPSGRSSGQTSSPSPSQQPQMNQPSDKSPSQPQP